MVPLAEALEAQRVVLATRCAANRLKWLAHEMAGGADASPGPVAAMGPWADSVASCAGRLEREWAEKRWTPRRGNAPRSEGGHAGTGSPSDDSGGAGAHPSGVHFPLWS